MRDGRDTTIMLAHNQRLQRLVGGGLLEQTFLNAVSRIQMFVMARHKDPSVIRLLRQVRKKRRILLSGYECFIVYSLARAYREQPGAMAEVGVFQGASAKMLCEAKGDKSLHLFDTFEGLPRPSPVDGVVHKERQYECSLEAVQEYLKGCKNVYFHKGRFPNSAADAEDATYCFVHFDVDLYESTLGCLQYFYPRMIPGGVMLTHDYSILTGVRKAFDEFFADKRECPIELPSTQCMVIKL